MLSKTDARKLSETRQVRTQHPQLQYDYSPSLFTPASHPLRTRFAPSSHPLAGHSRGSLRTSWRCAFGAELIPYPFIVKLFSIPLHFVVDRNGPFLYTPVSTEQVTTGSQISDRSNDMTREAKRQVQTARCELRTLKHFDAYAFRLYAASEQAAQTREALRTGRI